MAGPAGRCRYEPLPRYRHVAQCIGSRILVHGGRTKDFSEKRRKQLTTVVEIFNPYLESWEQKQVNGDELSPGTYASASASLRGHLYNFGGLKTTTSHKESNALHRLDTKTWRWCTLSPQDAEGAPTPKFGCGMVAFSSEYLGVFGGHALPAETQPAAGTFIKNIDQMDGSGWTNEFHIFNLISGVWSCPATTGERPPPCSHFTFTAIDDRRAALFGGFNKKHGFMNDLYVVNLRTQHWIKVTRSGGVPWPAERASHAACCLNYGEEFPQLLVTGGINRQCMPFTDIWILDARRGIWKMLIMSEPLKPRWGHTITAFSLGPGLTEVTAFGGTALAWKGTEEKQPKLAETTLLQFGIVESSGQSQWELLSMVVNRGVQERVFDKMRFAVECKLPIIEEACNGPITRVHQTLQERERVKTEKEEAQKLLDQARLETSEMAEERDRIKVALERVEAEQGKAMGWVKNGAILEKQRVEVERDTALKEKKQIEEEVHWARLEKEQAKFDRDRAMEDKMQAELEKERVRMEMQQAEHTRDRAIMEKFQTQSARSRDMGEKRKSEGDMFKIIMEKQQVVEERESTRLHNVHLEQEIYRLQQDIDRLKNERDEVEREKDRELQGRLCAEGERDCLMVEKQRVEGERVCAVVEKQRVEEERNHTILEVQRAERERDCAIIEKQTAQEHKEKVMRWAKQLEGEKDSAVAEKQKLQEQRDRAMAWAQEAERERDNAMVERQSAQDERDKAKLWAQRAETEKEKAVMEKIQAEFDKDRATIQKQEADNIKEKVILGHRNAASEIQKERESMACERKRIMIEKHRAEEERDRALVAKQQAENERDNAVVDKQRTEKERERALVEKQRLEEERDRLLLEKHVAASERCGALMDKLQSKGELNVVKAEKQHAEGEWDRAMISKQQVEEERARALAELQAVLRERDTLFQEKEQAENERDTAVEERALTEQETEMAISEKEQMMNERDMALSRQQEIEERVIELEKTVTTFEERNHNISAIHEQVMLAELRGPSWEVKEGEVEISDESLGTGGWAEVKVARLKVAAKCLHQQLVYDYHHDLFKREMAIAAKVSHPNLLRFLGARLEGGMAILTEFMPTSLRALVNRRPRQHLPLEHILSIAIDVACALNYLHNFSPDPIVHRDISSANVLLQPTSEGGWLAKLSDYGTANFYNQLKTQNPGNPVYTAPESSDPEQQTSKMDIYSFGVLLVEMCTCEFPAPERRTELMEQIEHTEMEEVITPCLNDEQDQRPTAIQLITTLQTIQRDTANV